MQAMSVEEEEGHTSFELSRRYLHSEIRKRSGLSCIISSCLIIPQAMGRHTQRIRLELLHLVDLPKDLEPIPEMRGGNIGRETADMKPLGHSLGHLACCMVDVWSREEGL